MPARSTSDETHARKQGERSRTRSHRQQQRQLEIERDKRLNAASNKHTAAIAQHHRQLREEHAGIWADYRAQTAKLNRGHGQ